jgi:hypothetical protein
MPAYAPDIKTGGRGTVVIGGVDVNVRNWTVDKNFTLEDITTTGDADPTSGLTYMRDVAAAVRDEISFDAFIDMNNDVLATLEAATPAAVLANVVISFRTGKTRTYPLVIMTNINMTAGGVVGANKYSVKARSQGPYTTV